jgi:RNA recognition motif-containing protein
MGKRLYVGNLPYDADEASLKEAFQQDGRAVVDVRFVMDRETGRPRGFAFVEMASDGDAQKAIAAMDGAEFGGRRLRVNEAEDRRGPGPGGPGGPRGPGGPPRPAGPRPGFGQDRGPERRGPGEERPSYGGDRPPPGGDRPGPPRPKPGWTDPPAEPRKYEPKKAPRRKHDEDADYGGRRGSRRFDDDDDSEW